VFYYCSKLLTDMKHRAASLRQQDYLFAMWILYRFGQKCYDMILVPVQVSVYSESCI